MVISRKINGAVPQTIDKEAIRTLPIPIFPMPFQLEIEKLVKDSNTALESSKALYKEAENLLYESLGIDSKNLDCHDLQGKSCDDRGESSLRWSETTEAIYPLRHCECSEESVANANDPHLQIHTQANYTIATFKESFLQTGRLDAEYYQAKYEKNEALIKNYKNGFVRLKDLIVAQSSGFAFNSDEYVQDSNLALIRINNIKNANLDMSNAVFLRDETQNLSPKDKVKRGDILISMSGSIGLSCLVREDINAMINQRICKISINGFLRMF